MSGPAHKEYLANSRTRPRPTVPIESSSFLASLIDQIAHFEDSKNTVGMLHADFFDSASIANQCSTELRFELEPTPLNSEPNGLADLIVGVFPLSAPAGRNRPDEFSLRVMDACRQLSLTGTAIIMLPSFYREFRRGSLDALLVKNGFFVQAIINTPQRYLIPRWSLHPVFIVISRESTDQVFALDCMKYEDIDLYFSNVLNRVDTGDLQTATLIDLHSFKGFEHWYVRREMESLKSDFGNFDNYELDDLSVFVNMGRTGITFEDIPNSIYLPLIGNGDAVVQLDSTSMKHQNYCQIVVDPTRVTPEFLCGFLNSKHFRLYLEAEKNSKNLTIPRLNRDQIETLPIGVPAIETQNQIGLNISKLTRLRAMVDELSNAIAINPVSSNSMTQKVDDALSVFGKLTLAEHIHQLLRDGESKTVEFKQSYSLDVRKNTKEKYIEETAIKTIAAFLNTDGGTLLIGVDDDANIVGVEREIEKLHQGSRDKFLLNFKNRFKDLIGEQFYPIIEYELIEVSGKQIFQIVCERSDNEVYVDDEDFYVRANPATDKLVGRKLTEYVRRRFPRTSVAVLG